MWELELEMELEKPSEACGEHSNSTHKEIPDGNQTENDIYILRNITVPVILVTQETGISLQLRASPSPSKPREKIFL